MVKLVNKIIHLAAYDHRMSKKTFVRKGLGLWTILEAVEKKVGAKIREQDYSFDSMVTAQIYQKHLPFWGDFLDDLFS